MPWNKEHGIVSAAKNWPRRWERVWTCPSCRTSDRGQSAAVTTQSAAALRTSLSPACWDRRRTPHKSYRAEDRTCPSAASNTQTTTSARTEEEQRPYSIAVWATRTRTTTGACMPYGITPTSQQRHHLPPLCPGLPTHWLTDYRQLIKKTSSHIDM